MRTTVTLDDDLLAKAHELSGIEDRPALLKAALEALIHMEASRRLAAMGGSDPGARPPPRRRPPTYLNEDCEWGGENYGPDSTILPKDGSEAA